MKAIPLVYKQVERLDGLQHMHIPPGQTYVSPGESFVEGDASSASYFLAGISLHDQDPCLDISGFFSHCASISVQPA